MLLPAAQYLTYAEAVDLYNQLRDADIATLVKTCGPPSLPFGDGLYYQLLIEEDEVPAAQEIVAAFELRRVGLAVQRCPRCGSLNNAPVLRPAWWKRLFYAGTTLYECQSCGAEFSG
ncbi:4-hydroxy-3-methylbut-2-en-1-yl diphosphate synthase [Hymenobacter roseosalivarius DSM 11622]|uniref:4-hydroxy-3-methylbut-2-en-1-yl diphosphate synthase n=1 Tax=Hymenobacter roseosalivarius DSM 11622 TaxID=645990 RepID=A0A1W1W1Z1_9BACT|nr:hypothetical protein [Hymenobacter roseosalivarius]SMB99114.1 4-hydroxy-3-methylbut-2-en-1-yl diphosphate synthase [Hymenobacter roseosalivarius DSM 11622]